VNTVIDWVISSSVYFLSTKPSNVVEKAIWSQYTKKQRWIASAKMAFRFLLFEPKAHPPLADAIRHAP
jgi:hypothetical protein